MQAEEGSQVALPVPLVRLGKLGYHNRQGLDDHLGLLAHLVRLYPGLEREQERGLERGQELVSLGLLMPLAHLPNQIQP